MKLSNKVALVTGGLKGIGRATVMELATQGADIALNYRASEKNKVLAEELVKELKDLGRDVLCVEGDISHEEDVEKIFKSIKKYFGHLDILVNNAGVVEYSSGLHDHTTAQWDKVLDTDLKGVFLMAREVSTIMMKQKYGRIINISSVGGIQAGPAQVSYFAAKGGVVNLTKAMAGDLAPYGILVNAIAPGVYDTEMTHDALDAPGSLVLKNRVALKRFGREGEMNGALIYFASDACTYTTGQLLVIDGGMTSML